MQDQIEINNSLIKNDKQKQKKIINFNSLFLILYLYFKFLTLNRLINS